MVARRIIAVGISLILWCGASLAVAQDVGELTPAERNELGRLFSEARDAHDSRDFETSIRKLKAAYEIFPEPNILYRVGEMHEALDRRALAADYYERYLKASPEGDDRTMVLERIEGLRAPRVKEATVASRLTIVSRPAGAIVSLVGEGDEQDERLGNSPIEVELAGGTYTLRISREGYEPLTRRITLSDGELRTIDLALKSREVAPVEVPDDEAPSLAVYYLAGASVVGAVAGVVALFLAADRRSTLDEWDAQRGAQNRPAGYDDVLDQELTFRVIGWSAVGVSAALAVSAGIVWWLDDDEESVGLGASPSGIFARLRF